MDLLLRLHRLFFDFTDFDRCWFLMALIKLIFCLTY